jgi:hypothetical protein
MKLVYANATMRFVGLRLEKGLGLQLHLPLGFPKKAQSTSPDDDERAQDLVIRQLIRNVLRRFYEDESDRRDPRLKPDRNGGQGETERVLLEEPPPQGQVESAARPSREAVLNVPLRDKAFDRLVDWMRRPEVRAVRWRQGWIDGFDAKHLHRAWPRALYTKSGPVFDATPGPRRRIEEDPQQPVLGLAAWLVRDAVTNLEGKKLQEELGGIHQQVDMQARAFAAGQGLMEGASLFISDAPTITKIHRRLSAALDDARKRQAALLPAVRELLHRCEAAVHFQIADDSDGVFGIKGFWPVWEALCADWALNKRGGLDEGEWVFCWDTSQPTRLKTGEHDLVGDEDSKQRLEEVFNKNGKARRPDLVTASDACRIARIIDYKYFSANEVCLLRGERSALKPIVSRSDNSQLEKAVDSLEAYRLLAVIHNYSHGATSVLTAESVPIELWLPGQPDRSTEVGNVLPKMTIRYLCPKGLMESYVQGWKPRP